MEHYLSQQPAFVDTTELIADIVHDARSLRRRRVVASMVAVALGFTGLEGLIFGLNLGSWAQPVCIAYSLSVLVFVEVTIGRMSKRHEQAIERLAELGGTAAIGPLLESLNLSTGSTQDAVVRSLCRLLPLAGSSYPIRLTASQQSALYAELISFGAGSIQMPTPRFDLRIQLIRALPLLGDSRVLALAEQIALQRTEYVQHGVVVRELRNAVPKLKHRLEREAREADLLRSAEIDLPDADLLRPVHPGSVEDRAVLLLPANRSEV